MARLADVIKDPAKRRAVVEDCAALIDAEVHDKGGMSGIAIKTGYKAVKSLKPGMIQASMDHLLDDFSLKIDPFWEECQNTGANPRDFFVKRKVEVANALLSITDDRAKKSDHKILVKTYTSLRPKAIEHIGAAMPRFADLAVKHAS